MVNWSLVAYAGLVKERLVTIMENTAENTTIEEQVTEESVQTEPSEDTVTYTQEEVDSAISKAVNAAILKVKKNQAKSNEDLTLELNELKAQLQRKENESFVATEVTKQGLPSELTELFYGEDNEVSKAKIKQFSKWFNGAVDSAVELRLNSTKAPQFSANTPGASKPQKQTDFLDFYANKSK